MWVYTCTKLSSVQYISKTLSADFDENFVNGYGLAQGPIDLIFGEDLIPK